MPSNHPKNMNKVIKKKKIKAYAGFTDGKMYLRFDKQWDAQEFCIYKTKWRAKLDFQDVLKENTNG